MIKAPALHTPGKREIFQYIAFIFPLAALLSLTDPRPAGAADAGDFVQKPSSGYENIVKQWQTNSAEVETKFKNHGPEALAAVRSQLNYIYLNEKELLLITELLLKSGSQQAAELAGEVLGNDKFGYSTKMAVLTVFARFIDSAAPADAGRAVERIERFIDSPACAASKKLYVAALRAIAGANGGGASSFKSRFEAETNLAIKTALLDKIAGMKNGLEILTAEFEKARHGKDAPYAIKVLKTIAGIKDAGAGAYLAKLIETERKNYPDGPFFETARALAATRAQEDFLPEILNMLDSASFSTVEKGFEYLRHYPLSAITAAAALYSKTADARRKTLLRKGLLYFLAYARRDHACARPEEASIAYSLIKEAFETDPPAVKKNAFDAATRFLNNDAFRKLAATDAAAPGGFFIALAFFVHGEKNFFIERLKAGGFEREAVCCREIAGEYYSRFTFVPGDFKDKNSLDAFFRFAALQNYYLRRSIIESVIKSNDASSIKKLVEFSLSCAPGFIEEVKRAIVSNAASPAIAGDESLLEFSGYRSARHFIELKNFEKRAAGAGGKLKKYLLALKNAGNDELKYAAGEIVKMLKKDPSAFADALGDDYYPLDAKLLLLKLAEEIHDESDGAIDAACLAEITLSTDSDARLASQACALLAALDPKAALDALKKALAKGNENGRRELFLLRTGARIKTPECAKFIIERFVAPAVGPMLAAEPDTDGTDETAAGELKEKFKTAVEVLYEMGPASREAAAAFIKEKPGAAHLLMDIIREGAGEAALKHYLDGFNAERTPARVLEFLRTNATAADTGLLKEFYEKNAGDAKARLLAAALFHKNGIPGPAAAEMLKKDGVEPAWIEKLLECGFGHDFIADFYEAGEKYIDAMQKLPEPKPYALTAAVNAYRDRFAADASFPKTFQEEIFFAGGAIDEKARLDALSDAKTRRRYFDAIRSAGGPVYVFETDLLRALTANPTLGTEEIVAIAELAAGYNLEKPRAAACERLKKLFDAAMDGKKDGAARQKNAEILDALIGCSDIAGAGELAALAGRAVKERVIDPRAYAGAVFRLCSPFDADASWRALKRAEKKELMESAFSSGYLDAASLADKNDFLYALDAETLAASRTADAAFIDGLIGLEKKEGAGYSGDLHLVRLVKTAGNEEKLKYITTMIDDAGNEESYYALETAARYLSLYAGDDLKKSFAAHYSKNLFRLRHNDELVKTLARRLAPEALLALITAGETSKDGGFETPQAVFDAYAASDAADRYERLQAFCESDNYHTRNCSIRALHGGGDKSFTALRSLFEKHAAAGSKRNYEAGDYLSAMAETGSTLAESYLITVAGDEKFAVHHERAIAELGEIKTAGSLEWLVSILFSGRRGEKAFYTLKGMCYDMTVEFIEAERKAAGRARAALASILFQNSIRRPFLEIMAAGLEPVFEIGEAFRPPAAFLENDSRDGTPPKALVERAVAAVSTELKKSVGQKVKLDEERIKFHSYLCSFLAYSRDPDDTALLIKLLADDSYAYGAGRALAAIAAAGASEAVAAAARSPLNPPSLQKRLITVLTERNAAAAVDIYLKALSSADRSVAAAALEAVSKFKIKEAVPVMAAAVEASENEDYYLAGVLASFADEALAPLSGALATARNPKGAFYAIARIIDGRSYDGDGDGRGRGAIENALKQRYSLYRGVRPRAALLTAFLLARLDEGETLKTLLAADENALLAAGADLFYYMDAERFAKLGAAATPALMKLLETRDERLEKLAGGVLDAIEKTGDPAAAPFLAAYVKRPGGDGYIKRRALELLGKISRDGAAAWIAVLSNEKDYYLKRRAAEYLAETAANDEFCRAEALRLLRGGLEDDIKAVLVKALAAAKYEKASAAFLEALKNSSSRPLLDAAAEALFKLDIIASIRPNLKNILTEAPDELNQAYAARVFAYYQDSVSVDAIGLALEKAIDKAGIFKKIELIKAAAAIKSPKFLKPLSRATAAGDESVREAAVDAIRAIAGAGYERYCAPGAAVNLSAVPRDGAVALRWEAPRDKQPAYYQIYRDQKLIMEKYEDTAYEDKGLKNGKNYAYQLKAVDANGNAGPFSETVSAVPTAPPGPVEGLKLQSGLTTITLEWKYISPGTGAVELSHFTVERDSKIVARVPPDSTAYTDYGLSAGKIYSYKVYAVNAMGGAGEKASISGSPHFDMKGGQ